MNTATLIQRTLELAATLDVETTDVLVLAQKTLDVTLLNLDDEGPPRHILGLCKDASILLISIHQKPDEPTLEDWDVFAFSDPGQFEKFLHDPAYSTALPPEASEWLLSAYQRVHLMETLEPGHA